MLFENLFIKHIQENESCLKSCIKYSVEWNSRILIMIDKFTLEYHDNSDNNDNLHFKPSVKALAFSTYNLYNNPSWTSRETFVFMLKGMNFQGKDFPRMILDRIFDYVQSCKNYKPRKVQKVQEVAMINS